MRTKKSMISFLLAAAMIATLTPATVFADEVTIGSTAAEQQVESTVQLETQDVTPVNTPTVSFADGTIKQSAVYTGQPIVPTIVVKNSDGTIVDPSNYSIAYDNGSTVAPITIGVHYITVTGLGTAYQSLKATLELDITSKNIAQCNVGFTAGSYKYTGSAVTPIPVVKDATTGASLVLGQDFTVAYGKNVDVGKGTVTITGIGVYAGTKTAEFKIVKNSISSFKVTLSKSKYTYNGKTKKPLVTISNGVVKLANSNYKVSYKNNKRIGTATVTVTAKGKNIYGKKTLTFKILPATPKITKLSSNNNGVKLNWSKSATASGYYIYRSADAGKTYKKIARTSHRYYTDKKVEGGKKYTYYIVAYKGNYKSADSAEKTILKVLGTPKFKSIKNTGSAFKITWSKISGASSYELYRKASGEEYVLMYKGTKTTYTDKAAVIDTTYSYKVVAVCKAGKSTSKVVKAKRTNKTKKTNDSYAMQVIRDPDGYRTFYASWKKVSGASSYEVWWSTDKDFGSKYRHYGNTKNLHYEPQVSACGKGTWYIKVRAVKATSDDKVDYSAWSKVSTFTIK